MICSIQVWTSWDMKRGVLIQIHVNITINLKGSSKTVNEVSAFLIAVHTYHMYRIKITKNRKMDVK